MKTIKVFAVVLAVTGFSVTFSLSNFNTNDSSTYKQSNYKNTDTTDGGIKNPGAGDNPYPTIRIPGK